MRINLTSTTYARMSLATSPLTEAVTSLRELACTRAPLAGLQAWRRQAACALQGIDLEPILVLLADRDSAEILSMPPTSSTPRFADQLEALVAAPAEWVHRDIRRMYGDSVPAAAGPYLRTPRAALDRLADTLEQYWTAALQPWWPRLSTLLEQDLLFRAQTLTRQALPAMIDGLHPDLHATDDAVFWTPRADGATSHREMAAGPQGVVFVASPFVRGRPWLNGEEWDRTAIFYGARGVGNLGQKDDHRHPADALSILLSNRRADLVRGTRTPSTPSALARMLGVTSSAVSQQLAQLMAAGLVSRHQVGRKAYYQLTASGHELLKVLDQAG